MPPPSTAATEPSTIPGALVAINGIGVLLTGESGVGKSDTLLGLLDRGHHLIADDAVELYLEAGALHGRCPQPLHGLLAIRGLGVLDVAQLFGAGCLLNSHRLDLEIALEDSAPPADPLMVARGNRSIMGSCVPYVRLPATGQRNLPLLLETAVKMHVQASPQTNWSGTSTQPSGGKEDL